MEQSLSFEFKTRYYKTGEINERTKEIWIVLHGYAQLAFYFIQKFKPLIQENICIIAPEGLSRFYATGASGRVGASWMTKENRLVDIENYITYLDTVYRHEKLNNSNIPITILGFSQGAATASRWAMHEGITFSRLILWAGIFPNDMDLQKGNEVLKGKEVILVYGLHDPYLNDDRMAEMNLINTKLGVNPRVITFDGGHVIQPEIFDKILNP